MITLYGIRNCDTCRKASKWLDRRGVPYRFHDLRRDGIDDVTLDRWLTAIGAERLINRRGRTWREIPEPTRIALDDAAMHRLVKERPTLIRRPVVEWEDESVTVGFDPRTWESRF